MGAGELTSCSSPLASVTDIDGCTHSTPAANAPRIGLAFASLWIITFLGAVIGTAVPTLAPGGRPHPTMHGGLGDFASIAATNARVLSAPFLLALFRFPAHRRTRQLGNVLIAGMLGANALRVGLALGRWHARLLPYMPQLPLEWLAAAVAAATWLTLRTDVRRQTAIAYLAAVLVLVVAAAAVETIATPHARPHDLNTGARRAITTLRSAVPIPARRAGVDCLRSDRAPAPALASRSLRSLPLTVARFRSAVWPALPGYVNHPRIPQRRDHSERSVCYLELLPDSALGRLLAVRLWRWSR